MCDRKLPKTCINILLRYSRYQHSKLRGHVQGVVDKFSKFQNKENYSLKSWLNFSEQIAHFWVINN